MAGRSACFVITLIHLSKFFACFNINKIYLNQSLCFMCCIIFLIGDFIYGIIMFPVFHMPLAPDFCLVLLFRTSRHPQVLSTVHNHQNSALSPLQNASNQ